MTVNFSDSCPYEIQDTESYNIFFCKLEQPSKIDKVIYNGCIILKIIMNQPECSRIAEVWYSCTKKLNRVAWRDVIDLNQSTQELPKEKKFEQKKLGSYAFSGQARRVDKLVKKKLKNYLSGEKFST